MNNLTILIILLLDIIIYEIAINYEKFQEELLPPPKPPSKLKIIGNSTETAITLYWHKPTENYEKIYSYLIYTYEPNKDVNLKTIPASTSNYYEKTFYNMDPKLEYKFKVRAVSTDGLSDDSNIVILKPADKNKKSPSVLPPLSRKINCFPDGTYKIGSKCEKSVYPSTYFNDVGHDNLLDKLNEKPKKNVLYF